MKITRIIACIAAGAMLFSTALNAAAQQRKRVAVLSFTTSTEAQHGAAAAGITGDVGADVADLLMRQLFQDKQFLVVERSAIDQIIKEQNFSNSDRANPATAAKIGKLAGVDAMIIGSVTNFTFQRRATDTGSVMSRLHVPGGGAVSSTATNVNITITARMIDTGTGVLINDVSGTGASSDTKTSASGLANTYDPSGANFSTSVIGSAMTKAVSSIATSLEPKGGAVAGGAGGAASGYSGVVADVTGKTLILTVGTNAGVKVGDTVEIVHPVKTVKNPETGEVLKVVTESLGLAKITEADAGSATATYMGTGAPAVNDKATLKP
jgi:curli biogenesis system outer membrane secretion channel CsgG